MDDDAIKPVEGEETEAAVEAPEVAEETESEDAAPVVATPEAEETDGEAA
jgi:hypothetical protein